MEIIKTAEQLNRYVVTSGFIGRTFKRDLLAFWAATQLFDEDTNNWRAYLPYLKDVATFIEPAPEDAAGAKYCVGIVKDGRAGIIPITAEVVKELCDVETAPNAPF